ncbi:hypothetical protein [Pedobacter sp. MW01-1-1]|uniref:hypothetical protein n=1 Tax=Pedobacter sp. MW01-1-1 TaxID=3383027 RepID=UPI003FEE10EF
MNTKLKTLQIIHIAFCMAVFFFMLVTTLINKDRLQFDVDIATKSLFDFAFPIIGLLGIIISMVIFKNLIAKIDKTASLEKKFNEYLTAFIASAAILEGCTFFTIVGSFITQNAAILIFSLINLLYMVFSRPTKDKVIYALQLQYPDTEAF